MVVRRIVLIPVGPVQDDLLSWLEGRLAEVIDQDVSVGEQIPIPANAYNPGRNQYLGEAILSALRMLPYPNAERLVGLVDADCYAKGLNFIFGQAGMNRREAFVAMPRLRQSFYGQPEDPELFRERILKEVVHELGHTWGLPHCPDPYCIMHFSNMLDDTDVKSAYFCSLCQMKR